MKLRTIATLLVGMTAICASCVSPDSSEGGTQEASATTTTSTYAPIHGDPISN